MRLDKRHESIRGHFTDFQELNVVQFAFNLTSIVISDERPLKLSRGSLRRRVLSSGDGNSCGDRLSGNVAGSLFNGISLNRLFQICQVSKYHWTMITTAEFASKDFERFKRFVNKRRAWLANPVRRRRCGDISKIPALVRESCKSPITVIDESRNGVGVAQVHTACRDCIFATYKGKTQIGCTFDGRLEKFEKLGAVVPVFDNEKEFYVINNRYCSAMRTTAWAKTVNVSTGETLHGVARKEIALRVDYVIVMNERTTENELCDSLRSLRQQELRPHAVILASNQSKWRSSKLISMMDEHAGDLDWWVTNMIRRGDNGDCLPDSEVVDEAFPRCTGHVYVRLNAGTVLPTNISQQLDEFVTDKLGQFAVLEADDTLGVEVVHTSFHKFAKGNQPIYVGVPGKSDETSRETLTSLPDKARFYENAGNSSGMLLKVGDVCK